MPGAPIYRDLAIRTLREHGPMSKAALAELLGPLGRAAAGAIATARHERPGEFFRIVRYKSQRWRAARRAQPTPPAQEAQKPLAWGAIYCGGKHNGKLYAHSGTKEEMERYIADRHQSDDSNTFRAIPIYTAPQPVEREPLTDEQVARIARSVLEAPAADGVAPAWELAVGIARAIEAAHGIGIKKENGNG